MESRHYHGTYDIGYQSLGLPGLHADHHGFEYPYYLPYQTTPLDPAGMLPTQYATVWDIRNRPRQTPASLPMTLLVGPTSPPRISDDSSSFASGQHIGFYSIQPQAQSQHVWQPYTGIGMWNSAPHAASRVEDEQNSRVRDGRILRELLPQVTYRAARQYKELKGPRIIEFPVDGERGIRLSDALEENWVGLEGRDDRPLFGDDRVQIMIRLHIVGCEAWQSKIYTTDHTVRRQPISRTKLAYEVAKNLRKFLEREKAIGHDGPSHCGWGNASLRNMYLTRLHRVSNASWQPEIFIEQPFAATTLASMSSA